MTGTPNGTRRMMSSDVDVLINGPPAKNTKSQVFFIPPSPLNFPSRSAPSTYPPSMLKTPSKKTPALADASAKRKLGRGVHGPHHVSPSQCAYMRPHLCAYNHSPYFIRFSFTLVP